MKGMPANLYLTKELGFVILLAEGYVMSSPFEFVLTSIDA